MSDTAATTESTTSTDEQSFLSRLVEFGDDIIAAERPVAADVPKVLGGLIHWIDQGGKFIAPESFNPNLSQAVAEQEAEQSRLAAENAELNSRVESLETLMRQTIAASGIVPSAPQSTEVDGAPATTDFSQGAAVGSASEGAAPPVAPASPVPGVPAPAPAAAPVPPITPADPPAPAAPPTVTE